MWTANIICHKKKKIYNTVLFQTRKNILQHSNFTQLYKIFLWRNCCTVWQIWKYTAESQVIPPQRNVTVPDTLFLPSNIKSRVPRSEQKPLLTEQLHFAAKLAGVLGSFCTRFAPSSFHERCTGGNWYSSGFNANAKSGKVGAVSMILTNTTPKWLGLNQVKLIGSEIHTK